MICKRCHGSHQALYASFSGALYPAPCPRCRRHAAKHEHFMCFLSRMLVAVLVIGGMMFQIWSDIMAFSPEIP